MNKWLVLVFSCFTINGFSQKDTTKWVRAFPITDYIVDLSDSVKIVQIQLPDGTTIPEKQIGLLKGLYRDKHSDTSTIGFGRCNLIKGNYYYFTINYKKSGKAPAKGDLLHTFITKTPIYYGKIARLSGYYIGVKDVYDKSLYDRYNVFSQWKKADEEALVDSMVSDIHFTGKYFLENNPSMNVAIKGGKYQGKMVLNTMITSTREDVFDFLDYMIARPNLYAGHEWKISEIFATWLSEGAPTVIPPALKRG